MGKEKIRHISLEMENNYLIHPDLRQRGYGCQLVLTLMIMRSNL